MTQIPTFVSNKKTTKILLFHSILFVALCYLLSSCASMSTLQTARTTEKKKLVGGFSGGTVNFDTGIKKDTTPTSSNIVLNVPFIELYARYGITDKWDAGMKLTIIGTFLVDTKYQFLGDDKSKFAGSIGLGLGTLNITSGDYTNKVKDVHFPLYLSYHSAEWFGLYANPRYIMRFNSEKNGSSPTTTYTSNWYGATGGIRLGKKSALFLEYSYFLNSKVSNPFTQFTVGLGFGVR